MLYRFGEVSIGVNEYEAKDSKGNTFTYVKYFPSVSYRNEKGEWVQGTSFNIRQLAKLRTLIDYLLLQEVKMFSKSSEAEAIVEADADIDPEVVGDGDPKSLNF